MKWGFPDNRVIAAASVHALTASGVFWAFLALLAAVNRDMEAMFAWLGVALFVDGIDGPLARGVGVRGALPHWDGDVLDLVVDYLTYVFIPAYAAYQLGLFPYGFGLIAVAIVLMSSAVFFCSTEQKTTDNFFMGFPTVWNLALFYALIFNAGPWIMFSGVLLFSALTLTRMPFVHPLRVKRMRIISVGLLFAWSAFAAAAIAQDMAPEWPIKLGLAAIALYFTAIGVWRMLFGAVNVLRQRTN